MLKFYWNGIKDDRGKLQKCWYSGGPWINLPSDVITIYARTYDDFSKAVRHAFKVENDTDVHTDYFEKDRIRVYSDHPLYAQVKQALEAHRAHFEKKAA